MQYPMRGQAKMGHVVKRPHPCKCRRSLACLGYLKITRANTSANILSNPPKKNPAAMAKMMTTVVNRAVSSRLGQTDFRSSEYVSCRKLTGPTRPPPEGAMIR